MFLLNAACMVAGMMSLILFATADVQYYDDPDWRIKKKAKKILSEKDAKNPRAEINQNIPLLVQRDVQA